MFFIEKFILVYKRKNKMIDFKTISITDKTFYNDFLLADSERGCEFSFTNLFMWGIQKFALLHDHIVLYSEFDSHCFYPFPIGNGDKKAVLEAIFEDAKKRGLCPCLTGLNESAKETLETLYPGQFYFHADRNSYDYVYNIHDLADLKGRKLHRKRNHLKHFKKNHPEYIVEPISNSNIEEVRVFISEWYQNKLENNPEGDYHNEQIALEKALAHFHELGMEGLVLKEHNEVLAFTMASQMSHNTYDVHYEKARGDIDGAYTTINSEFANYIRNKHPHIEYLDREEDMGIPGLRKAKQSYFPHHLVKKYRAFPLRYPFSFDSPEKDTIPALRNLWKEAFQDSDTFLDQFFTTAFDKGRCRISTVDGKLAAALYWFDCTLDGQPLAYIYAVATAKEFRGNGACHTLLANTHKHLKSLGYTGAILVPGNDTLVHLYEGCEYETCTKHSKIECAAENMGIHISEISKDEYALLRQQYLPKNSVLQENENLDFLVTQAKFYTGENFLLAAHVESDNLYGIELLGDATLAPGIIHALGCKDGTFFTPGKDMPFAMFHGLSENAVEPNYFGFAFD